MFYTINSNLTQINFEMSDQYTLSEFIPHIIQFNTAQAVLDKPEWKDEPSKKGCVYEKLWNVVLIFGCVNEFPNSEYSHYEGNPLGQGFKKITSIPEYLKRVNVFNGNQTGISDFSMKNKGDGTMVFSSCKFFKEEKAPMDYDIYNTKALLDINGRRFGQYKLCLFLRNKKEFEKKNKKSKYKLNASVQIFDLICLEEAFIKFKIICINNPNYIDILEKKKDLELRFHQQMIVKNTLSEIHKESKNFLWGCKPRSGKTFMAGGLIKELDEDNILIITPVPKETTSQFTDMFSEYDDFKKYEITVLKHKREFKNPNEYGKKNIFITSRQLLQQNLDTNFTEIKMDLVISDENHFGGTTELSKDSIQSVSDEHTVKVFMTATFMKPLLAWNIHPDCCFYWGLEQEQLCKQKNLIELHSNYGEFDDNLLDYYENYPDLHYISLMFDDSAGRYQELLASVEDTVYEFSFDALFKIGEHGRFENENDVERFLRYLCGSKRQDYSGGRKSIFDRVEKLCHLYNSRQCFTQLWFLPMRGINEISIALKTLMEKNSVLSRYSILIVNSERTIPEPKNAIDIIESEAKANEKRGLIILAGGMLNLGVSLKNCDVVMMFHDSTSSDKVIQQMYRCMTEDTKKTIGIIVDLNTDRILYSVLECYNNKSKNIEERLEYILEHHLIDIDSDMFACRETEIDSVMKKLMEIWNTIDIVDSIRKIIRKLYVKEISIQDQEVLNSNFTTNSDGNERFKIKFNEDGQEIKRDLKDKKKSKGKKISVDLARDVLPFAIPLIICVLTIRNETHIFIEMIEIIKNDETLLHIFNEQSVIWWGHDNVIDIVKDLCEKYVPDIFDICLKIKMRMACLIDEPAKLLEFIADNLKPKDLEKEKIW